MGDTLSLFSGAGGFDLAAHAAGLTVVGAVDRDVDALRTLHDALGTPTSVAEFGARKVEAILGDMNLPEVRYVIGGPPCTAFSHAGFWLDKKRQGLDPAAGRIDDFVDAVRLLSPAAFVLENVPGLAFKTHSQFFDRLVNRARNAGYSVSWEVLNAREFGVAQARRRLFVVGVRGGPAFPFDVRPLPPRSSGWAISDLSSDATLQEADESIAGAWGHLLPDVPPGGNYLHFTEERGHPRPLFKYRGRYWSFLLKLDPSKASPTLPAQRVTYNGPFHWDDRHLRVREMARLQGFPDWYPWASDVSLARRHVGNAVPVPLGAAVLRRLREHLGDVARDERFELDQAVADTGASYGDVMAAIPRPSTPTIERRRAA